jgi:hypothetical protein
MKKVYIVGFSFLFAIGYLIAREIIMGVVNGGIGF